MCMPCIAPTRSTRASVDTKTGPCRLEVYFGSPRLSCVRLGWDCRPQPCRGRRRLGPSRPLPASIFDGFEKGVGGTMGRGNPKHKATATQSELGIAPTSGLPSYRASHVGNISGHGSLASTLMGNIALTSSKGFHTSGIQIWTQHLKSLRQRACKRTGSKCLDRVDDALGADPRHFLQTWVPEQKHV